MQHIVSASPFRCRMWDLHNRLDQHITEETCRAEIESFSRHGQMVAVLGRLARGDNECEIELIFGARRLFVAQHLNVPLKVELREISDRDGIIAMDIENRQRVDISPYERGLSYARWLRAGYFESQDDLAKALHISPSQISRLLKLANLPSVIVNAFSSAQTIRECWGADLAVALEDSQRRRLTLERARALSAISPRPPAAYVYQQLTAAAVAGRKPKAKAHDEVVKDIHGRPLFRIRFQSKVIALLLPIDRMSTDMLNAVRTAVSDTLCKPNAQTRFPPDNAVRPRLLQADSI